MAIFTVLDLPTSAWRARGAWQFAKGGIVVAIFAVLNLCNKDGAPYKKVCNNPLLD